MRCAVCHALTRARVPEANRTASMGLASDQDTGNRDSEACPGATQPNNWCSSVFTLRPSARKSKGLAKRLHLDARAACPRRSSAQHGSGAVHPRPVSSVSALSASTAAACPDCRRDRQRAAALLAAPRRHLLPTATRSQVRYSWRTCSWPATRSAAIHRLSSIRRPRRRAVPALHSVRHLSRPSEDPRRPSHRVSIDGDDSRSP